MSSSLTDGRLLTDGRYRVVLTTSGTGFSALGNLVLTRWHRDAIADMGGLLIYLRDVDDAHAWSVGRKPIAPSGDGRLGTQYRPGCLQLTRTEHGIEAACETAVVPGRDAEVRRLRLRNDSKRGRTIEVTTYCEVVLHDWAADAGHPGFSKLFVETGRDAGSEALWARRRPRSRAESFPCLVHVLHGPGVAQYETDRARFIGRGRTLGTPHALARALSGTTGSVLDPVFAIRRTMHLAPDAETTLVAVLAAAPQLDAALAVTAGLKDPVTVDAAFAAAADQEAQRVRRVGVSRASAERLQRLAVAHMYGDPLLAAAACPGTSANERGHEDAGGAPLAPIASKLGLNADAALIAVHTAHGEIDDDDARALVRAASYWSDLGFESGWALLCEHAGCNGGAECRAAAIAKECRAAGVAALALSSSSPGAPALQRSAAATVSVRASGLGDLGADATHTAPLPTARARMRAEHAETSDREPPSELRARGLRAYNGYGGFSADGAEYRIRVDPRRDDGRPPMPWINVVANPQFGFLTSESGAGYTWSRNSRERRITPWSNDPICDPHGEALYLADQANGDLWSPLPGPSPAPAPYDAAHGFGYSTWSHTSHSLSQHVTMFVPPDESVKIVRVRLRATPGDAKPAAPRALSLTSYARLVLGDMDLDGARTVATEIDGDVIFARSRRGGGFDDAVVFAAAIVPASARVSLSADRLSFIGAHGTLASPTALLDGRPLDGRAGAGLDPCAAIRAAFTVGPGEDVECSFLLGEAPTREQALATVARYREAGAVGAALESALEFWRELLTVVQVETPDEGIDSMLNGWALYQTGSCRLWGRSAFYQSGGAFGFRDQLQDSAAFLYARPAITREQIVLHAGHQFPEGDVLHWWHPPIERGTRTRFSDDLCWLAYITSAYLSVTGDASVLDEQAPFVRGPLLAPGQDEAYIGVESIAQSASVYEHCCLALDRSLTRGAHGLPLMGTGDWNDGMNRVGREGKGESVWMAFFLYAILGEFIPICRARGDGVRADRYHEYREGLRAAVEDPGWDGEWYRRAYYDDGAVLGSAANDECRIDVLAQAWAVLSGAASRERCRSALDAVERMLVVPDPGLIRLLAPPFDRTPHDPGYIKGYVPGIRENGGQYTHAALWAVRAAAELGDRERAMRWLEMILPLRHAADRASADLYKVEPYVVAADVYGVEPHLGRGGWTWYTGSAAWMYRTILESILGLAVEQGRTLVVRPRVPDRWPGYRLRYRLGDGTTYVIDVTNPGARAGTVTSASMDGREAPVEDGAARIDLSHDGREHAVLVTLGAADDYP